MKLFWLSIMAVLTACGVLWMLLGDKADDVAWVGLVFLALWGLAAGVYGIITVAKSKEWVDNG